MGNIAELYIVCEMFNFAMQTSLMYTNNAKLNNDGGMTIKLIYCTIKPVRKGKEDTSLARLKRACCVQGSAAGTSSAQSPQTHWTPAII